MVVYRNQRKAATARPAQVVKEPSTEVETAVANPSAEMVAAPVLPPAAAKGQVVVANHPLSAHALSALRDKRTLAGQFRNFGNQLLMMLVWEASKNTPLVERSVETPLGECAGSRLGKPFVFLSLSKSVLGISHHVADFVPNASIGTVVVDKEGGSHKGRIHLSQAPALCDAEVLLFDPLIGDGESCVTAIKLLQRSGAKSIAVLSFIISAEGLKRVQSECPSATVYTAAIDADLDPKRGPVPGLGNVGERLFS